MKDVKFNNLGLGVQCILHTLCNLNCKFCFETKEKGIREYTKINIDYIRNLPNEIIKVILPIIESNKINQFSLYIMGGELFSDNIPDSIFDVYKEFLYDIKKDIVDKYNIQCKYNVVTNGVYIKRKRISSLLRSFDTRIILSYDPIDRFNNDKQKEIWLDTFNYFRDNDFKIAVSTLLTKRNIYAYANDPVFNSIDNSIFIDSNIYVPRLDYHDYLPNDDDLYNFYKWCIDNNKYNVSDVNSIMKHSHICRQEFYFMFGENIKDNHISNCLEGLPFNKDDYYGKYSKQIIDDTDCLKYKQPIGLQKRGCYMCEYYLNCSEMCWTQILFKEYKITQCPIKRIYQYIDKDNTIIDRFNIWRDKNESIINNNSQ